MSYKCYAQQYGIVPVQWYLSCELQCSQTICALGKLPGPGSNFQLLQYLATGTPVSRDAYTKAPYETMPVSILETQMTKGMVK